jgi:RNA polymerase sigma-70 factor (ECF subfamily)
VIVEVFTRCRPRLLGVAYGVLGDLGEAEDVVQDTWLRFKAADPDPVQNVEAFLVTVTTRLAIDRLRSARRRREEYVGPWLPEPLLIDDNDPESLAIQAADLSLALLSALERLNPIERAVLVLRDVFDFEYADIADIVDKTPTNCRQLAKRARERAGEPVRRYRPSRAQADALVAAFTNAVTTGDTRRLEALLAADAILYSDGGAQAAAARKPIYGAAKIGRFFAGVRRKGYFNPELSYSAVCVNGDPGVRIDAIDRPLALIALEQIDGTIVSVRIMNNPEKLTRLEPHPRPLLR